MRKRSYFNWSVLFIISFQFAFFNSYSQTKGLIYKPAGTGQAVLDPNLDGYVSETNQGFMVDDEIESEIPFVPLPVVGSGEPPTDNSAGPSCGFVDLVKSNDNETIYTYSDANNLMFRFRLGGTAENSKGYTILVDADGLFGDGSDPDYTAGNPGFEYEITLRTNFGVSIYDIDNNTLSSTEIGDGTVDRPYDDFAQKAIAGSTVCGTDYFYDFYVPYADLPYSSSTPVRMVGGTTIAPKESTGFKMADLGGIDDESGVTDDLFQDLIDVFPPTSGDDVSAGATIDPRATCPLISGPIGIGETSVSGTTSEVDGATIEVFRDGVSQGTTLASGGSWILSGITATVASEVFTATAKVGEIAATATATSKKSTSFSDCSASTVGATCSNSPTGLTSTGSTSKTITGNSGLTTETFTVKVYGSDGTTLFPNNDLQPAGDGDSSPYPFTGQTGTTFAWEYDGSSALPDGVYYVTITETSPSSKCESIPTIFCKGVTASSVPTIPATVTSSATSILVSNTVSGAVLTLYIDDVESAFTVTSTGATATISGITGLEEGQSLTVLAKESGFCPSETAVPTIVTLAPVQSAAPTIEGEYCGATTSISGVTASGANTKIDIYTRATSGGAETLVGTLNLTIGSSWTVSGLTITVGEFVVAKATGSGETESTFGNEIEILSQTTDGALIITNPASPNEIRAGDASISGKGTPGYTVFLYLDGFIVDETTYFDVVDGSGDWTISGLDKATAGYDVLYAEAVVTVTAKSGALCESDPSAGETVLCQFPDNSMIFSATSATTICAGQTVDFSVSFTEDLVVYELVDKDDHTIGLGPASLGDGNALTLTSYPISSTVSGISLIASRIGITCDQIIGTILVSPEEINLTHVFTDPTSCTVPDGTITLSGLTASESYTLDYTLDGVAANSSSISADGSGNYVMNSLEPGNYTDITISGTAITLICDNVITGPVVLSVTGAPTFAVNVETGPSTCSGTDGSITFTSDELSASYTLNYLLDGVAASVAVSSDAGGAIAGFTGLSSGVYSSVSITNTVSGCKSNVLGPFTLSDPDPTIFVAGVANPSACGGTGTINLGFTGFTDGTYTILHDGGSFAGVSVASNAASITTALAGSYTNLRTTESTTGCLTSEDPDVVLSDPATHAIAASRTNPTTCGGLGSVNFTFTGVTDGNYDIDYDGGSFSSVAVASNSATVSALAGTYNNLSLTFGGCVSTEFPNVILSDPSVPSAAVVGTITQPTCSVPTGSVELSGLPAGNWTINPGSIVGSGTVTTITGLTVSTTHNFTVTETVSGCTSTTSADVVINAVPTVSAPVVGTITQPTCSVPTGSVDLSGLPSGNWTINPGAIVGSGTVTTITGLAVSTTHNFTVTETSTGCSSSVSGDVVINAVPSLPTITLDASPSVTQGSTSADLSYSGTTNSPNQYSIDFDATAEGQGFADVAATSLPVSPISLSVPGAAAINTYNGTITVINSSTGCSASSVAFTITISAGGGDITPPTLTINTIATDDIINAVEDDSPVTVSGTTDAEDGQVVTVNLNGETYAATVTAGAWSVDIPAIDAQNLAQGTSTLTADVNDLAGNPASQATKDLVHDSTPPTLAINTIATDDIINAVEDDSPVTVSGTTDAEDGQVVTVNLNGETYAATVTAGAWSVDIPAIDAQNLAQGTSTLTADVNDLAGNPASQATKDLVHDSTPPTLAINTIATDDIINAVEDDSPVTVSGTTDAEDGQVVTVNLNGETYAATVTAGAWSVDIPAIDAQNLAQGTSTLTADVNDLAGNPASQATKDLVHDSTPPTLAINTIATDDIINAVEDDSPVTVSGTTDAEDGQVVTVNLNGETYAATVTAGAWSVDIPAIDAQNLAQGTSTLTADVNDLAGNPASQATKDLVHDSTPPTLAINTIATDDIINAVEDDSPVTVSGTTDAEDGQVVTVNLNGETYAATVTAGAWSVDIPAIDAQNLAQGTSTLTADVNDLAGNPASQATKELVHDSTPPTLAINTIATDDIINAVEDDSPVTVSGTTDAEDGQVVTINLNGETYAATVTAGAWSVDIPAIDAQNLAQGTSTLTADVNDLAGNPASQATRGIVHDSTAPVAPTVDALSTSDTTPVLTGTAEPGSTVSIVINGTTFETTTLGDGTWSINTETDTPTAGGPFVALVDGDYNVVATSTDEAGNSTTETNVDELTIDTSAPVAPTVDALSTNDPTPVLTGTAEPGSTVSIVINGTTFETTTLGDGTWSINTETDTPTAGGPFVALADGDYNVVATSTDAAGNSTTETNVDELTIDTSAPVAPTVDALSTSDTTPVLTGTAEPGSTVSIVINGTTFETTTLGDGTWSINTETDTPTAGGPFVALVDGDYNVVATSTDAAGNSTTETNVDELTIDTSAPVAPTVDALSTSDTTPVLTGTAEPGSTVSIVINGTTFETTTLGDGTWSINTETDTPTAGGPFVALVDGDYNVVATSTDEAGNSSTDQTTGELTIDQNDEPNATAVIINADEDNVATGSIASNVTDPENHLLSFTLQTTPDPVTEGTMILNTDGSYTFTPVDNYNGSIVLTYEVCDNGNPSLCVQESITINVNAVNDFPVAVGETLSIDEDNAGSGTLIDNVTDEEGNALTFGLISAPNLSTEGTLILNPDGTYSFIPVADYNGSLTFIYEVCDNGNPSRCSQASVAIEVSPVNDVPVAADGTITSNGITESTGTLADFTSDPDGDVLSYSLVNAPTNGTLVINADGTYTYTPESDFAGTTSFTYEVCDEGIPALCDQAIVTITINSTDTDNDGVPDSTEDVNGDGDLSNDDSDGDGTPNYLDTDDDGDGVPTSEEDIDENGNAANDNTDGDNLPNYLDPDDDGDGILTKDEDTNQDGDFNNDDCDGNNVANYLDAAYCDTDGDGIFDNDEDLNSDGDPYNDDCDGDAVPNFLDVDSCDTDGDGVDDQEEDANEDGNPYNDDCDEDGTPDFQDPKPCSDELDTTPVITPNNDGFNDFMEIEGIENYPNNIVHVFNRWGNLVWKTRGYDNTTNAFGGLNNSGLLTSNGTLPDGTYFVIIDKGDGSPLQKDFVVIKR